MVKYSFVISTQNRKYHLKNTLAALNYQDGFGKDDYEVVVVDEGSDDNSEEYIKGVNKNYSLVYIYHEKNSKSGISKTRNTGWKNASGEIIIFLDSDIIVKRDYLEEAARTFELDKDILLFSTRLMLPEDATVGIKDISDQSIYEKYSFSEDRRELFETRHLTFDMMSYCMQYIVKPWRHVFGCSMALTKELLMRIGEFDENFTGWGAEDNEFAYRVYTGGSKLIYNYKLEGLHQYHKESDRYNYKNNLDYFIKKHPRIKEEFGEAEFQGFINNQEFEKLNQKEKKASLLQVLEKNKEKYGQSETNIINVMDKKEIPDVKTLVTKIAGKGCVLIVNDFVEKSDLHVWIQLETYHWTEKVCYFPMSRKCMGVD